MKPNKLATFLTGIISLAASANAQTNFTILKSFTSVPDGNICYATLVPDTNGWLYGTTFSGGTYTNGTIFAIRTNAFGYAGTNTYGYVKLASFNIATNGALPYAGVTLGSDGNFYGTTYTGGTFTNGVIFMAHKDGSGLVALHSFVGGPDGKNPQAGLIEASDGALYGTTYFSDSTNRGTIFKINKDGSGYSVLHIFTGNPDGQQPQCRLLEGSDGMLYGTAAFGGSHNKGTVFSLSKDGSVYNSSLYAFGSNTGDGGQSESGLIEASDHALYGTTYSSGGTGTNGTIFKINKDGSGYQVIHGFSTSNGDGQNPDGELIEGLDDALYGVTYMGGAFTAGTIYKLNKDGTGYQILRSFSQIDGSIPRCALIQLNSGVFYGTTEFGGVGGAGCVFALSSNSMPARIMSITLSGGSNTLQSFSTSVINYDVLRSTNLVTWQTLATVLSQTNGKLNYSDINPPSKNVFYRLQVH